MLWCLNLHKNVKTKLFLCKTLELFIALEMVVYYCFFSLGGNLDFLDFIKKTFITSTTGLTFSSSGSASPSCRGSSRAGIRSLSLWSVTRAVVSTPLHFRRLYPDWKMHQKVHFVKCSSWAKTIVLFCSNWQLRSYFVGRGEQIG